MEALSRARRELNLVRPYIDSGLHSVKVPDADSEPEYALVNARMARLTETVATLMQRIEQLAPVRDSEGSGTPDAT
jgi:hypothetical protein